MESYQIRQAVHRLPDKLPADCHTARMFSVIKDALLEKNMTEKVKNMSSGKQTFLHKKSLLIALAQSFKKHTNVLKDILGLEMKTIKTFEKFVAQLEATCLPQLFILVNRILFYKTTKKDKETNEEFLLSLISLAELCEFEAKEKERIVKEKFFQCCENEKAIQDNYSQKLTVMELLSAVRKTEGHRNSLDMKSSPSCTYFSPRQSRFFVSESDLKKEEKTSCVHPVICEPLRQESHILQGKKKKLVEFAGLKQGVDTLTNNDDEKRIDNVGKYDDECEGTENEDCTSTEHEIYLSFSNEPLKGKDQCINFMGRLSEEKDNRCIIETSTHFTEANLQSISSNSLIKEKSQPTKKRRANCAKELSFNSIYNESSSKIVTYPQSKQNQNKIRTHLYKQNVMQDAVEVVDSKIGNMHSDIKTENSKENLVCDECGKSFSKRREYNSHRKLHTCFCTTCDKLLPTPCAYKEHMITHTGLKPFQCTKCPMAFSRKFDLKLHISRHDPDRKKTHICDVCGVQFYRVYELRRHRNIHNSEKLHRCCDCNKAFSTNSGLQAHLATHLGRKSFVCELCGTAFKNKTNLDNHLRKHRGEKPFTCNICSDSFLRKSYLDRHRRLHTGEKPFSCNQCEKCFSTKSSFQRHRLVHTEEKPHSCSLCGLKFKWQSVLKTHLQSHEATIESKECNDFTQTQPINLNVSHKKLSTANTHRQNSISSLPATSEKLHLPEHVQHCGYSSASITEQNVDSHFRNTRENEIGNPIHGETQATDSAPLQTGWRKQSSVSQQPTKIYTHPASSTPTLVDFGRSKTVEKYSTLYSASVDHVQRLEINNLPLSSSSEPYVVESHIWQDPVHHSHQFEQLGQLNEHCEPPTYHEFQPISSSPGLSPEESHSLSHNVSRLAASEPMLLASNEQEFVIDNRISHQTSVDEHSNSHSRPYRAVSDPSKARDYRTYSNLNYAGMNSRIDETHPQYFSGSNRDSHNSQLYQ